MYKFTTNLNLNDEKLEVVNQAKLLGVVISDDLKWDKNTEYLVKQERDVLQEREGAIFYQVLNDFEVF